MSFQAWAASWSAYMVATSGRIVLSSSSRPILPSTSPDGSSSSSCPSHGASRYLSVIRAGRQGRDGRLLSRRGTTADVYRRRSSRKPHRPSVVEPSRTALLESWAFVRRRMPRGLGQLFRNASRCRRPKWPRRSDSPRFSQGAGGPRFEEARQYSHRQVVTCPAASDSWA